MPGPVERWLETFMCSHFAEIFEKFGYRTLESVATSILNTDSIEN